MSLMRFGVGLLIVVCCGAGLAQTFPSRPLRIVVPFPAGGPTDIVARLAAPKLTEGFVKTLSDPSLREKLAARGADPVGNTPEQFGAYLRGDLARWAKLARTTGIKVD